MLLTVSHGVLFDNSDWRRLWPAGVFPSFIRPKAGTKKFLLAKPPDGDSAWQKTSIATRSR